MTATDGASFAHECESGTCRHPDGEKREDVAWFELGLYCRDCREATGDLRSLTVYVVEAWRWSESEGALLVTTDREKARALAHDRVTRLIDPHPMTREMFTRPLKPKPAAHGATVQHWDAASGELLETEKFTSEEDD